MEFLNEFISPLILAGCLAIGFVLKNWVPEDKVNKYIPLIVMVCGVLFAWWDAGIMVPSIFVMGAISGLASTGVYELFNNFIYAGNLPCASEPVVGVEEEDEVEEEQE